MLSQFKYLWKSKHKNNYSSSKYTENISYHFFLNVRSPSNCESTKVDKLIMQMICPTGT